MDKELAKVMKTGLLLHNGGVSVSADAFRRMSKFEKRMMRDRMMAAADSDRKFRAAEEEAERKRVKVMAPGVASAISALRGVEATIKAKNAMRKELYAERQAARREEAKPIHKLADYVDYFTDHWLYSTADGRVRLGGKSLSADELENVLEHIHEQHSPSAIFKALHGKAPSTYKRSEQEDLYSKVFDAVASVEEAGDQLAKDDPAKRPFRYAHMEDLQRLAKA